MRLHTVLGCIARTLLGHGALTLARAGGKPFAVRIVCGLGTASDGCCISLWKRYVCMRAHARVCGCVLGVKFIGGGAEVLCAGNVWEPGVCVRVLLCATVE